MTTPETTPSPKAIPKIFEPEFEDRTVDRPPGPQMQSLEDGQPCRKADGERRKDDVEGNGRSELDPGQEKGGEVH